MSMLQSSKDKCDEYHLEFFGNFVFLSFSRKKKKSKVFIYCPNPNFHQRSFDGELDQL